MARFSNRLTRLARRRESEAFRQIIMPLGKLAGFTGLLGMVLLALDCHLNDRCRAGAFAAAAVTAALPVVFFLYRWMRGHFNRQLENP